MTDLRVSFASLSKESTDSLLSRICLFKKELFNLRFQLASGEVKDTSVFRKIKVNIARLNTELTKRKKKNTTNA